MNTTPQEQTISLLKRARKVLVVAPEQWNGDQVSAMLALHKVLTKAKKEVTAIGSSEVPKNFQFLGDNNFIKESLIEKGDLIVSISTNETKVDKVKYTINDDSVDILVTSSSGKIDPRNVSFHKSVGVFDVIITLGTDNLEGLGQFFDNNTELFASVPIINVSVSTSNDFFGKVNFVDTSKASICELLFEIIKGEEEFSKHLDDNMATVLLTGVISSTGSFLDPCTTASSLEVASSLQALGADQSDIIENLFKMKSISTLKVWGRVLGNLEVDPVHRISWSNLAKADFDLAEAKSEDLGDLTNDLLRHIKETDIAILFVEDGRNVKIQLRTSDAGGVDSAKLQQALGGAGNLVQNGFDFEIEGKTVVEIQFEFLKLVLGFQKQRHNIDEDVEIQKLEILELEKDEVVVEKKHKKAELAPKAPTDVPFEISSSKTEEVVKPEKIKEPKQQQKVEDDPKNVGNIKIPSWLKK